MASAGTALPPGLIARTNTDAQLAEQNGADQQAQQGQGEMYEVHMPIISLSVEAPNGKHVKVEVHIHRTHIRTSFVQ